MNRLNLLPENQIIDLLNATIKDVRDIKLLQTASSNGLVFYESQSPNPYDFDDTVATVGGGQSAPGVPLTVTLTAEDNTFLLTDLIIEAAKIDGADSPFVFFDELNPPAKNINKWYVFVGSNTTGNKHTQFKCRVVANTDVQISAEYTP